MNESASGVTLSALGRRLDILIEDPSIRRIVARLFADCSSVISESLGDTAVQVYGRSPWTVRSTESIAHADSIDEALSVTLAAINTTAVRLSPLLAFHAAVVARDNVVVAIPGVSGLGKSTLTAAMLQRGWAYISDESLALRWSDGAVDAYPRPIGLSDWSIAALGLPAGIRGASESYFTAEDVGATVRRDVGPCSHIVLLDRNPSSQLRLARTHRADAMEPLLRRGFTVHRDPTKALPALANILRRSQVLRLTLGGPNEAADLLTSQLEGG